ncbi:MAG: AsmA family protein [Chromatiales bacterium]|nr:AsmA family protein [Chromatiales bacterium]
MKRVFKTLLWTVAVLVVLIVAAAILVPLFVDPNDYKEEIAGQARKHTGRDLTITGDLKLSVFPWLGVHTGALALGNATGFGPEPFAAVNSANVRVKLLPLLSKEVEIDTIELDGLVLNLAKDRNGRSNWEDLGAKNGQAPAEKPAEGGAAIAALTVGGLEVTDATIRWSDMASGQKTTISGLDLSTGKLEPGAPLPVRLGFDISGEQPQMSGRLSLDTVAAADMDAKKWSLADLKLALKLAGEVVGGKSVDAELRAQVAGDLANDSATLRDFSFTTGALKLTGELNATALGAAPKVRGKAAIAPFDLRSVLADWGVALDTADANALRRASLEFAIDASEKSAFAENLVMTLDDSSLRGRVGVADFAAQALRFDLTLDRLDLDRYLPPASEKPAPADPAAATAAAATELPVEMLRALNLDGKFKLGELTASGLTMGDVLLTVTAEDGQVSVNEKIGRFYGGANDLSLNIDARGQAPKVTVDQQANGIQIGPVLQALTGEDRLTGTGRLSAKLAATGATDVALKKTLNGNLAFRFENGAVKGINVAQLIRETHARFTGKTAPPADAKNQTDFSELSASATVSDGILTSNDLDGRSPLLRIGGDGKVDLPAEKLDYTLRVTVVDSLEGQGGQGLKDLTGVAIPVRAQGPYANLGYSIDWGTILTAKAKDELKDRARSKLDKLIADDAAKGKSDPKKDLLRGLLGGGQSGGEQVAPANAQAPAAEKEEKAKPSELLKGLFR